MITIPIEVSNRHLHLSAAHLAALFGRQSELHSRRPISQTGQFAAEETVSIVGPKGRLDRVRVIGPVRTETQVELSRTDARVLGLDPPLRDSGDLVKSAGVRVVGPSGTVELSAGVIIQRRHIHATPDDCKKYGLIPGSVVRIRHRGPRAAILEDVLVKAHPSYVWRLHLDTDEGNAIGAEPGMEAEVLP